jgi:Ca2+/H+ antiporter
MRPSSSNTILVIKDGLLELVIASITGSILGNLPLVLGLSIYWAAFFFLTN